MQLQKNIWYGILVLLAVFVIWMVFAPPTRADSGASGRCYFTYNKNGHRVRKCVRNYRSTGEEYSRYDLCKDKVRGLGTQWIGEQGALDAAKKDWMERVRYDHGEKFLDLSHAEDFVKNCGRVSIGEVVGQVMYRCEITARPCRGDDSVAIEGQR